jgi:O-antigen/teichoic acid export membrane protein
LTDPRRTVEGRDAPSPESTADAVRESKPTDIRSKERERPHSKPFTGFFSRTGSRRQTRGRQPLRALIGRAQRDSLLRNSLFIILTTVANSACGFAFWLIAARLFAPRDIGLTAAITSASTIVVILATIGVGGTLIQSLPQRFHSESRWSIFWAGLATAVAISIVIGCATVVLLPLISQKLSVLHQASYVSCFIVGTTALGAGSVIDSVFIAQRAAGSMLVRNSASAVSKVLLIIIAATLVSTSALSLLGAWAAAAIVGLGFGLDILVRRMRISRPPRVSVVARTALGLRTRLAGNQLIGIGTALLPYLLPLFVTARLSLTENGYFYATWMMGGIFLIIAPAVSQALFAEGANDSKDLYLRTRSALGLIAAILTPLVAVIFVMGGTLLSLLGSDYRQHGVGLLRIVLLASIPDAIMNVYISVLRVRGRLMVAAGLSVGIGMGILALSWALLPVLGINAVGWAFLWMQAGGCVFMFVDLLGVSRLRRAFAFSGRAGL